MFYKNNDLFILPCTNYCVSLLNVFHFQKPGTSRFYASLSETASKELDKMKACNSISLSFFPFLCFFCLKLCLICLFLGLSLHIFVLSFMSLSIHLFFCSLHLFFYFLLIFVYYLHLSTLFRYLFVLSLCIISLSLSFLFIHLFHRYHLRIPQS